VVVAAAAATRRTMATAPVSLAIFSSW
jgi:hypothetical protein